MGDAIKQDAKALLGAIANRFKSSHKNFDQQDLANDLGWPLTRAVDALGELERCGLVKKPPTGFES